MDPFIKKAPFNRSWLFVLGLILMALPVAVSAQDNLGRGRVTGTIMDVGGVPIEGVLIVAQSADNKTKLEGKTDKKGRFTIMGLGTGTWRFTASKEGFIPAGTVMQVNQLKMNNPVELVLKTMSGGEAVHQSHEGLETFEKGNALMKEEKYQDAIKAFEEFLAKFPEVYQARLNIATAAMRMGDNVRADAEFKAALEKALPSDPAAQKDDESAVRALSGLGSMALQNNDFETARKYFARALEISPRDEAEAFSVGEIFFSGQQLDEAIKYFQLAIQIKPAWSKPYYKLGLVYLKKGDYALALECLNKFVEIDSQNPEVPSIRAMISAVEKLKK